MIRITIRDDTPDPDSSIRDERELSWAEAFFDLTDRLSACKAGLGRVEKILPKRLVLSQQHDEEHTYLVTYTGDVGDLCVVAADFSQDTGACSDEIKAAAELAREELALRAGVFTGLYSESG